MAAWSNCTALILVHLFIMPPHAHTYAPVVTIVTTCSIVTLTVNIEDWNDNPPELPIFNFGKLIYECDWGHSRTISDSIQV